MSRVEYLIETIKWYKDEYHKSDFGHQGMLVTLDAMKGRDLTQEEERWVANIDYVVDGGLDRGNKHDMVILLALPG